MPRGREAAAGDFVLSGGLIVDGSGGRPFVGSLLVRDSAIARISDRPIRSRAATIDCRGKVVAPGFIDVHSHLDWRLPIAGRDDLMAPIIAQGITSAVGGNCGLSIAGFREDTRHRQLIEENLFTTGLMRLEWDSVRDCYESLASSGIALNMALLAGHGSTRVSMRGFDPSPLHPYETSEMLRLLAGAMDQGTAGVSLGLRFEPGIHVQREEIEEIARLVAQRRKVLAVRLRAYSALSTAWPARAFGEPHNLRALREVLDLARRTGVRLQVSHLAFVGPRTWRSAEAGIRLIDRAIRDGVEVCFDVVPHLCGVSEVNALMPAWFLARLPAAWNDASALRRLARELRRIQRRLGLGARDLRVADAKCEEYAQESGRLLSDIARRRRLSPVDALIDLARRSRGRARVLLHRYSNPRIVAELIRHRASLFATDACVELAGAQNPAAFGAFPRLLALCRDQKLLDLEQVIHRMTAAAAQRFGIQDRGILAERMAADIVVFDWNGVSDNTSDDASDAAPSGIEHVFVNGVKALSAGHRAMPLRAGRPLGSVPV